MKIITEQQLRNVIRQELKNYLFEQEEKQKKSTLLQKLYMPIVIAMSLIAGHQSSLASDGKLNNGDDKVQNYEEMMNDAGMNSKEAQKFLDLAGFDEKKSERLWDNFSKQEEIKDSIEQLQAASSKLSDTNPVKIRTQTKIKELEAESKILNTQLVNDQELSKSFLNAGPVALQYILNKGALTGDAKEDYKKMIQYGIENAPLLAAQQAEKDLQMYSNNLGILAPMSPQEKIIGWLNKNHPGAVKELTADPNNSWTNIELLKILTTVDSNFKPKTFEFFKPEGKAVTTANQMLDNPANSYDASEAIDAIEKVQKSATSKEYHPDKMTDEEIEAIEDPETRRILKAEKAKLQGKIKESKVNKLRQRLNELRGVYV